MQQWGPDGDIEESLVYVLEVNADGSPLNSAKVPRPERNYIHVHYLPARRDPAEHITYSTNAILGRMLRSVNWDEEREVIQKLTEDISANLVENSSVEALSQSLASTWGTLHKGTYFAEPAVTFVSNEIESLLRHLSISFSPGHDEALVDFSRLSDGQKSMLYLSLVLSFQAIGRATLAGDNAFDVDKLRPPVFTLIAIEEPENSLSPHYLGRIVAALNSIVDQGDAQALMATHAPSILHRVEPESIRYLRLDESRQTKVTSILMPPNTDEAHKYVRAAVKAFPEIYFSRLVVLGEGDSEEIVLPRLLEAKGAPVDELAVTIAPLGGRHVNHFWRLLEGLEIPYITLLDIDLARYQGGWGRIKYVNNQLKEHCPENCLPKDHTIPAWNSEKYKIREYLHYLEILEQRGIYFSFPMDLDFSMLNSYPEAYEVEDDDHVLPKLTDKRSVLGKSRHDPDQYDEDEQKLFITYHKRFKLGSKPAAHINALSILDNETILADMPPSLDRLVNGILDKLSGIPE